MKRVIGMPGDIVEIKDKIVYVNGKEYTGALKITEFHSHCPIYPKHLNILPQNSFDYVSMNSWYEPYRVKIEGNSTAVRKVFNRDWFSPIQVPERVTL